MATTPVVQWSDTYEVNNTVGVAYASALADCENRTDPRTCATNMSLTLDLFQPSCPPWWSWGDPTSWSCGGGLRPAIVFVHGGSYITLDSTEQWDHARWFAQRGFVAVSINYRLARHHGNYPAGWEEWEPPLNQSAWWANNFNHMYPAVRDAKAAVRWVRANAEDLGIEPSTIIASGSSAGGCSVIGLGSLLERDYKDEISANDDPTLATTHVNQSSSVAAVMDRWGAVYAVDAVYFKDQVPRYTTKSVPTIAFHGLEDHIIVPENTVTLCDTLGNVGVECTAHFFPGAPHGCFNETVDGLSQNEITLQWLQAHGLVDLGLSQLIHQIMGNLRNIVVILTSTTVLLCLCLCVASYVRQHWRRQTSLLSASRAGTKRMTMKGANVRLPWNAKSRTRTRSDIEDEDGERTVAPFRPSAGGPEFAEHEVEMSDI